MIINEIHLLDEDITRQEASSASSAGAVVPAASESLPLSSSSSLPVDELMTSVIAAQSSRMHSHFTELLDDYTATKIPPFEGVASMCYLHLYIHCFCSSYGRLIRCRRYS